MKELVLCLVIVCLSWIGCSSGCDCGKGRNAGNKNYPWIVSVSGGCRGSIITPDHVLTAAQCTEGKSAKSLNVTIKSDSKQKSITLYVSKRIIPHEHYKRSDWWFVYDISVLLLSTPVIFNQFVSPVCLPSSGYNLVGKFVKAEGWGTNGLREVDVKVISNDACEKWMILSEQNNQLCTTTPRKSPCQGKAGGPVVYLDPRTKRYTQVALVSFGEDKCRKEYPIVHTDIFSFIEWIKNAVKQSQPSAQICTN